MNQSIDVLLKWPYTPFVIAFACASFFYVSNGGLRQASTAEEHNKKKQLPWLATMVFVMSLVVVLIVRFFADSPSARGTGKRSKTLKGGAGEGDGGYTWHPDKTLIGGRAIYNAYKGKAPF